MPSRKTATNSNQKFFEAISNLLSIHNISTPDREPRLLSIFWTIILLIFLGFSLQKMRRKDGSVENTNTTSNEQLPNSASRIPPAPSFGGKFFGMPFRKTATNSKQKFSEAISFLLSIHSISTPNSELRLLPIFWTEHYCCFPWTFPPKNASLRQREKK